MSDRAKPTSPPGVALSTRHTPRRHSLAAIGAVLTVVAGSVILTKAAVAEPFPGTWSVTMVSEGGSSDGEWIGKGFERSFDDGNASVHVDGTYWSVGLGVSGGTYGESFGFSFDSGTQGVFGPDFYTVDESAEAQPGRPPGMSISGEGRACNTVNGNFEVRDIAWSSTGRLERLWLLYEQRCSSTRALFGEIRLGMPTVAADVAPDAVRWPDNRVGPAIETVPVRVRPTATSPVTVSGVTLTGAHPEDFRIRLDQCTGRTLYDDDACEVFVRFTPQSPGPRSAVLRVATDAGIFPVRLDGNGPPGVTSWDLTSDPGDLVGRGDTFQYTSAVDTIWHTGTAQSVRGLVQAADTEEWDATFKPAQGEVLVAGATYPNTHEPTSDDAGPKMGVYRQWSFCGTLTGSFTVNNLDFLPTTGALDRLDVTFEQHCEGYAAALRGRIRYRDRADTAPPASVTGITATRTSDTPVHLTWTNPPDSDHAGTVVRYLAGENSPGLATVGNLAYTGTGSAVDIPGLKIGRAHV